MLRHWLRHHPEWSSSKMMPAPLGDDLSHLLMRMRLPFVGSDYEMKMLMFELLDFLKRPGKEVVSLEKQVENLLMGLLLENPELDKEGLLALLYSKRSREKLNQVLGIVERMRMSPVTQQPYDIVSLTKENLTELRKSVSRLADGQERLRLCETSWHPSVDRLEMSLVTQQPHDIVPSTNEKLTELVKAVSRLADGQERLRLCDSSWHPSLCYPLPRESICDTPDLQSDWHSQLRNLDRAMEYGIWNRKVAPFSDLTVSPSPDVVSLLSLGGTLADQSGEEIIVKPDTFENKYVLVCCIDAPALAETDGCQCLLNLCSELSSERADDVKMVMVARMNILADTKEVFKHLFSGFPKSCLAVPYEDWERRERIWKLLRCDTNKMWLFVYDTDGIFLTTFCVDGYINPYGAEAFPFTEEKVQKVHKERLKLRHDRLDNLLRPYESSPDVVVQELNGPREKSLSEVINNKHVGLFMCCECYTAFPFLRKLYKQCKERNEEFEIVVLYLPLLYKIDPHMFKETIDSMFQKQEISGWCLPFNNSVSLRFWGLTEGYVCGYSVSNRFQNKLIIVGPDGVILDMFGCVILNNIDGFDAYPFTREAYVKKEMSTVWRDLRLELLLVGDLFRGDNPSDTISAETLLSSNKKIFVFLGRKHIRFVDEAFASKYKEMKHKGVEFEVVFIQYPSTAEVKFEEDRGAKDIHVRDMPWYILRRDGTCAELDKLEEILVPSLVGFGEDGHIRSVKPLEKLYDPETGKTAPDFCLDNTLYQDIYRLVLGLHEYPDI